MVQSAWRSTEECRGSKRGTERCGGSVEGHGGISRPALRGCTEGEEGKKGLERVQGGRGVYRGIHGGIHGVLESTQEYGGGTEGIQGCRRTMKGTWRRIQRL